MVKDIVRVIPITSGPEYSEKAGKFVHKAMKKAVKEKGRPVSVTEIRQTARSYKVIPGSQKGSTPMKDWFVTRRYVRNLVKKGKARRATEYEAKFPNMKLEHFVPKGR
jgi:hypothetical protein